MKKQEYNSKVIEWRENRYQNLKAENGWLAVAGLHWLNEGKNLVGSNPTCEVVLPERAPGYFGMIELDGKKVRLDVAEGVIAKVNGRRAKRAILRSTYDAKPSFFTWNDSLRMVIHEYKERRAVRIWDNERKERFNLPPLTWFPVNEHFRVPAKYTRYKTPKVSDHPSTMGESIESQIDGYLTFRFERKTYTLDVSETEEKRLFLKFRDGTSGRETYPPSRYLYTEKIKRGEVLLDFNYAYSPPCAYTEFATCLFAPPQNVLPFRVEAGEKYLSDGH